MQSPIRKYSHIVIVTHELYYGATQSFRDYLNSLSVQDLRFLSHPIKQDKPKSYSQVFHKGKLVHQRNYFPISTNTIAEYIHQFILTVWFICLETKRCDIVVAANPLNCIAALVSKFFGKSSKVIFYAIDFTPKRFSSGVLNFLYHQLEKYCVMHADICWNVSPRIASGREHYLHISQVKYLQKVVPMGIWERDLLETTHIKRKPHQLVFVGHMLKKQGVQLILTSMSKIIKVIPYARCLIIGGGEYLPDLKRIAKKLRVEKYVTFTDWEYNQAKIRDMLLESSIALAPYDPGGETIENFTYYADPTKIKTYLSAGLPVIMTNVPYNSSELAKRGCARIIEYTEESLSRAVVDLLSEKKRLTQMRKIAMRYMESYTWEKIFKTALLEI